MNGKRVALLVGCSEYQDREFHRLPAPVQDLAAFKPVLADPTIGDFTVNTLLNEPSRTVSVHIERFFSQHKPDDHLLLYFSCHGILDPRGRLYFVATDTKKESLEATGISARWVKEQMDHSRSQRIVLLLDCCYSGAFAKGLRRGSAGTQEIIEQLGGRGRVVITASDKLEYAYDSEFTNAVVGGLRTGAADLDGDGQVSVHELYHYVYDQVRRGASRQTPTMSADDMHGQFYLAKNPHAPLPLPVALEQALASENTWERLWAVDGLRRLLASDAPGGQKRTARQTLARLRGADTDRDVQKAADEVWNAVSHQPNTTGQPGLLRRWLVGVGLVLTVVLALVLVNTWPPTHPSAKPIPCSPSTKPADGVLSFGTLLPKTGQFGYAGSALDAGVRLAMKDINDAGGIPGVEVKLDDTNQRDEGDSSSADTASQSTDALLAGGVDVIIGPSTSTVALNVIDKVTCAGVILFSPSNTASVFTTYPTHGLYFRTASPSGFEGSVLGKLVVADGNSTVVVMSRDDVYGNPLREATVKAIQESGGRVLDSFHYNPDAPDHSKEIQRVKAENPDAIVLISFTEGPQILANMIKERIGPRSKRVYGPNMSNTLAGLVSPQDPGVVAGMKGTLPDAGSEAFVKRLREANPGLRDLTYAAPAYHAVVITALAAAVAGTDAPAAVAKEIDGVTRAGERCTSFAACMTLVKDHKAIAYDGPSGPLRFTDHGEPSSATYDIGEIQANGTVKTLRSETVTLATTPAPAQPSGR